MTSPDYTLMEEVFLAQPVEATEGVCDVAGCFEDAALLVPGALLCVDHAAEFGVGSGPRYSIPCDALTGGAEWRTAREAEYVDRLRDLRERHPETARRTPQRDRALDRLIRRRAAGLVAMLEREGEAP